MRENWGFLAHFINQAMDSMDQLVNGTGEDLKVGLRRRTANLQELLFLGSHPYL